MMVETEDSILLLDLAFIKLICNAIYDLLAVSCSVNEALSYIKIYQSEMKA